MQRYMKGWSQRIWIKKWCVLRYRNADVVCEELFLLPPAIVMRTCVELSQLRRATTLCDVSIFNLIAIQNVIRSYGSTLKSVSGIKLTICHFCHLGLPIFFVKHPPLLIDSDLIHVDQCEHPLPCSSTAHFLGPGTVGRSVLRHIAASYAWALARVCNADMRYNHPHYAALHNQEIQEWDKVVYDQNNTK